MVEAGQEGQEGEAQRSCDGRIEGRVTLEEELLTDRMVSRGQRPDHDGEKGEGGRKV